MKQSNITELIDELDALKGHYQKGESAKIPGPLERARHLARQLQSDEESEEDHWEYEEALRGHVMVEDIYPREELKQRAIEHADSGLKQFGVSPEDARVRYLSVEDGVMMYKIEHEKIPRIGYEA